MIMLKLLQLQAVLGKFTTKHILHIVLSQYGVSSVTENNLKQQCRPLIALKLRYTKTTIIA